MLEKLAKQAGWRRLSTFLSPALLDVVSVPSMVARGRRLRTSRRGTTYRDALRQRAEALAELPSSIQLVGDPELATASDDALGEGPEARARRIVTLYFHQLYDDAPTLLDLRARAFEDSGDRPTWSPAPWVCEWDRAFLHGLRETYSGFYGSDDARFRGGLEALGLESAEDLFRDHFGGEVEGQRFRVRDFTQTFHAVFVRCRDAGVRLPTEVLPLGIYLAALYDALDGADVAVDVRACHALATVARPQRREVDAEDAARA